MKINCDEFDLTFFADATSLIEGDIAELEVGTKGKVRLLTVEAAKLNAYYKGLPAEEKESFKREKISPLNALLEQGKIVLLGKEGEENARYHLLEILLKKYDKQKVLVVCNDRAKANLYLPLIPVYEVFGQRLVVATLKTRLTPVEFPEYEQMMQRRKFLERRAEVEEEIAPPAPPVGVAAEEDSDDWGEVSNEAQTEQTSPLAEEQPPEATVEEVKETVEAPAAYELPDTPRVELKPTPYQDDEFDF